MNLMGMIHWMRLTMVVLSIVGAIGCGPQHAKYDVQGTVTWDGKPLDAGEILFVGADNTSSEAAKIRDGRYQVKTAAGRFKVMVNASERKRNPNPPGMRGDDWYFESTIPARYNQQTTLTAEIAPREDNRCDFALTKN